MELMDSAMGSQLIKNGLSLPTGTWSAGSNLSNPELVYKIHKENISSGANYITTNTFRTTPRAYMKMGLAQSEALLKSKESMNSAIRVAKKAAGNRSMILGSIAPLEDCYRPDLFPGYDVAVKEFKTLGEELANGGVDIIIMETMISTIEIESCLEALRGIEKPIWVGLNLSDSGSIQSGESIESAIEKINKFRVKCLLLNCNSVDRTASALKLISSCWDGRWGIYPNLGIGKPSPSGIIKELSSDQEFLATARMAVDLGANILGGCCGSSPRHIRLLRKEFL